MSYKTHKTTVKKRHMTITLLGTYALSFLRYAGTDCTTHNSYQCYSQQSTPVSLLLYNISSSKVYGIIMSESRSSSCGYLTRFLPLYLRKVAKLVSGRGLIQGKNWNKDGDSTQIDVVTFLEDCISAIMKVKASGSYSS